MNPTAVSTLREKLGDLIGQLDEKERHAYRLIMSMAVGDLAATDRTEVRSQWEDEALTAALHAIDTFRKPRIYWKGRPPFVDDTLLAEIQAEAREVRSKASRNDFAWMHMGGPVAQRLRDVLDLASLLGDKLAAFQPSTRLPPMYLYYLQAGDRIDPHLDEDATPINALLMVEHSYRSEPSRLLAYVDGQWQRIFLAPGEMIVFDGAATIHARAPIGEGETVSLLTVRLERR